MTDWAERAPAPFRDDRDFRASLGASADALLTLLVGTALTVILGPYAAIAFVVPLGLMARAFVAGRSAARRAQSQFATHEEWKAAERQAVAKAFGAALLRPRRFRDY